MERVLMILNRHLPETSVSILSELLQTYEQFQQVMIAWLRRDIDFSPIYHGPYDWNVVAERIIPIVRAGIIVTEAWTGHTVLDDDMIFIQRPMMKAILPVGRVADFRTGYFEADVKYLIYQLGEARMTNERVVACNFDWTQRYDHDSVIEDTEAIELYGNRDLSNYWWASNDRFNAVAGGNCQWTGYVPELIIYPEDLQTELRAEYRGLVIFSTNIDTDLIELMISFDRM